MTTVTLECIAHCLTISSLPVTQVLPSEGAARLGSVRQVLQDAFAAAGLLHAPFPTGGSSLHVPLFDLSHWPPSRHRSAAVRTAHLPSTPAPTLTAPTWLQAALNPSTVSGWAQAKLGAAVTISSIGILRTTAAGAPTPTTVASLQLAPAALPSVETAHWQPPQWMMVQQEQHQQPTTAAAGPALSPSDLQTPELRRLYAMFPLVDAALGLLKRRRLPASATLLLGFVNSLSGHTRRPASASASTSSAPSATSSGSAYTMQELQRLLQACTDLLLVHRVDGVTVRDVAREGLQPSDQVELVGGAGGGGGAAAGAGAKAMRARHAKVLVLLHKAGCQPSPGPPPPPPSMTSHATTSAAATLLPPDSSPVSLDDKKAIMERVPLLERLTRRGFYRDQLVHVHVFPPRLARYGLSADAMMRVLPASVYTALASRY